MQIPELHVRNVVGRYPRGGVLRSENVEVQVFEVARVYRIRLDDSAHPAMWMEITIEVATGVEDEDVVKIATAFSVAKAGDSDADAAA